MLSKNIQRRKVSLRMKALPKDLLELSYLLSYLRFAERKRSKVSEEWTFTNDIFVLVSSHLVNSFINI